MLPFFNLYEAASSALVIGRDIFSYSLSLSLLLLSIKSTVSICPTLKAFCAYSFSFKLLSIFSFGLSKIIVTLVVFSSFIFSPVAILFVTTYAFISFPFLNFEYTTLNIINNII